MKTLTLIRHAKSSWNNPSLTDFDRPLNKRGIRDAPKVGTAIEQAGISFDRVLCSDARRARQTLSLLSHGVTVDDDVIEYRHDMYGASAHHLLSCIAEQADSVSDIALVGHNPGMEDLANNLADEHIGAMSTCNVVQIEFDCDSWSDLSSASATVAFIIRPGDLKLT